MKTLKLAALFLISVTTVNSYAQLSNGLKAYYSFCGNTEDSSGNNNTGVVFGTPTLTTDRFGFANCAYQFPGNKSSFIAIAFSNDFNITDTGAFSISLWCSGASADDGDYEALFEKYDLDPSNPNPTDYFLALYDLNKPMVGGKYGSLFAFDFVPNNNWHHLVGIYNNKNWYLFDNNVLLNKDTTANAARAIKQSLSDLYIGRGFQGKIDDIRFYNRALTVSEIDQLFKLKSSCFVDTATTDTTTGIKQVDQNFFSVSPNPSNNYFTITFANSLTPAAIVEVFDVTGKKINTELHKRNNQIDVNMLNASNGLYLVKVTSDNKTFVQRLQKQD